MTAYEGHLGHIAIKLLKSIHLCENMDAVNTAAGPEVDHYELAL